MLFRSADDDDGNAAIERSKAPLKTAVANEGFTQRLLDDAYRIAQKSGPNGLRDWWGALTAAQRKLFNADELKKLKEYAEACGPTKGPNEPALELK